MTQLKPMLRRLLRPRRFHAYCVGAPKTGTHSIAGIFSKHFRSAHEPGHMGLIDHIVALREQAETEWEFDRYLKERDWRLWLEMEASHLTYFYIERLVKLWPKTKFILTVRDCHSWLESWTNFILAGPKRPANFKSEWFSVNDLRFNGKSPHPPEEKILAENGLYTLDGYLSSWTAHNRAVLAAVPKERLLVIRTNEIEKELGRIASFLGISEDKLDPIQSHSFKNEKKFNVLSQIDQTHLRRKMEEHCGELMRQLFGGIR